MGHLALQSAPCPSLLQMSVMPTDIQHCKLHPQYFTHDSNLPYLKLRKCSPNIMGVARAQPLPLTARWCISTVPSWCAPHRGMHKHTLTASNNQAPATTHPILRTSHTHHSRRGCTGAPGANNTRHITPEATVQKTCPLHAPTSSQLLQCGTTHT